MLLDENELNKLKQCAKSGQYTAEDIAVLGKLIQWHIDLRSLQKDRNTSLDDVYQYLGRDENPTPADRPAGECRESLPGESDG